MNNSDAGSTMEKFVQMPVYVGFLIKMMAQLLSHPMELARVNIQANVITHSRLTVSHMFRLMSRHGLPGFYYGIVASGLRCGVHTLSSYTLFYNLQDNKYVQMLRPYNTSTVLGITGFWGGVFATPFAKLAVIRQADITRGPYERRNYRNFFQGLMCMYRKGGLLYLFNGWKINALASTSVAMLYTPVSEKVSIVTSKVHGIHEPWLSDLITMALTGGIITVIMTPVDSVAILILNDSSHYGPFSYVDMCRKVVQKHGYRGFFFGWKPALMGLVPHTLLATFVYRILIDHYTT
ncbi:mitochondrial dicarboxylate transporter [Drosophila ficusphila]|uniref:mitochondrial dicarboxylate transporter n=1 Tax=Drosophila ficusphila TaxID=30025 RepID=UPI0007E7E407|nr:mitochondrial dicarboxylate transporter [Drosophila ficusphila]